ncbi:hypothetical protein GOODEAATRI_016231 [Goodea atripinnis]|uniref:Uncharacterized protein n=1 Tax=Goodea atripinnis TaxID=208336 RepID=A0ABV0PYJ2_9TELE
MQRDGCPKIVNLGSSKTDLFYERKKYGFKKRIYTSTCEADQNRRVETDILQRKKAGVQFREKQRQADRHRSIVYSAVRPWSGNEHERSEHARICLCSLFATSLKSSEEA